MQRKNNLEEAIKFIHESIDTKTGGSFASYSRIFNTFQGWSEPYPETSGYIIPTLFNISKINEYQHFELYALRMADWLVKLQFDDGALPGGLYNQKKEQEKSIFNTAQMILGLNAAYKHTNNEKYLISSSKATKWLIQVQENDGTWVRYNYKKGFFPSYYTRVAWPILQTASLTNSSTFDDRAVKTLDFINKKVLRNDFIKDSGFNPNSYAFLHTIAYTIRGFLESFLLSKNEMYFNTAYNLSYKLLRKYELRKRLAGAYYEDFKEINWYRCLTGEAQISIIWLKIFNITNDIRFVNATSKLLDDLCLTQPIRNSLFLKSGGIKGSEPYYGTYLSFRQPNWATKFFIDALLLEEDAYKIIENKISK